MRSASVRGRRQAGVLLAAGWALTGCGSQPAVAPSTEGIVSAALQDSTESQRKALADGVVTLAEYQAALDAWVKCTAAAGGTIEVLETDPSSGVVTYQSRSPLDDPQAPEGRCYMEHFDDVEIVFQRTDAAAVASAREQSRAVYLEVARPCLIANGLMAPTDADPGSDAFGSLLTQFGDLNQRGLCGVADAASP
jgi:hypothetical protein